jgi:hypothetical protein
MIVLALLNLIKKYLKYGMTYLFQNGKREHFKHPK